MLVTRSMALSTEINLEISGIRKDSEQPQRSDPAVLSISMAGWGCWVSEGRISESSGVGTSPARRMESGDAIGSNSLIHPLSTPHVRETPNPPVRCRRKTSTNTHSATVVINPAQATALTGNSFFFFFLPVLLLLFLLPYTSTLQPPLLCYIFFLIRISHHS